MKYLRYILFLFLVYIYMYNPPLSFLSISPKYSLYVLMLPVLLTKKFYVYAREIKGYVLTLAVIVAFSFFREIFSIHGFVFLSINVSLFFEIFIIPIGLIMIYNSLGRGDLVLDIIKLAGVAGLITVILISTPSLGDFVRYTLLKSDQFTESVAHRTFGISESLTFSYGLIQGLMFALTLFYSRTNKLLLFLLPLFLISVLFNARIGFVPIMIGAGVYFLLNFDLKRVVFISLGILVGYLLIFETNMFVKQKETIEWGLDFFSQLSEFSSGKTGSDNTFKALFGDMLVIPQNELEWLIGTGENIFGIHYGKSSDVGYIIQLTYGGIVYVGLLLLIVKRIFTYSASYNILDIYKYFGVIFVLVMLIANVKGNFFTTVGIFRLIVLLSFWIHFSNREEINSRG